MSSSASLSPASAMTLITGPELVVSGGLPFAFFFSFHCQSCSPRTLGGAAFLKLTNDPIASRYPGSLLEHHHFNYTRVLLGMKENNVFQGADATTAAELMAHVEAVILATDLANHFKSRGVFRQELASNPGGYDRGNAAHRLLLIDAVVTSCDLCATSFPQEVSVPVVHGVFQEFFDQGDEEKALGHPPGVSFVKEGASVARLQRDFVDAIPEQAYRNLVDFFPQLKPLHDRVLANRKAWDDVVKAETEAAAGKQ